MCKYLLLSATCSIIINIGGDLMKILNKNYVFKIIISAFIICISLLFTACVNKWQNNGSNTGSNTGNKEYAKLNIDYMQCLTADISNATAIGVEKMSAENQQENDEPTEKYYLVKYTDNFDKNNPEFDKNGLTKVSFCLTRQITEEVYDHNGTLIESNNTIEQDDLPAQINKFYVYNNFTLVQYIPEIASSGYVNYYDKNNQEQTMYIDVRPNEADLQYDENGISTYDKGGYYSDLLHQSFVIDNSTGYIYILENIIIDEIKNNLIMSDNKIYDIKLQADGELQFVSIVHNQTIEISDYWKDKHNNIFIKNNSIDAFDSDNNVMYFTGNQKGNLGGGAIVEDKYYILSKENITICIDSNWDYPSKTLYSPTGIYKIAENYIEQSIENNENYTLMHIKNDWLEPMLIENIKNGILYIAGSNDGSFSFVNISTLEITSKYIDMGFVSIIDNNQAIAYFNNTLYKVNIWGPTNFETPNENYLTENTFESVSSILLENCIYESETNIYFDFRDYRKLGFKVVSFNETNHYKIVLDDNKQAILVNSETYIAPEKETIKLQPINKE